MSHAVPAQRERMSSQPAVSPIARAMSAEARSRLSSYLDLLAKWNRVYNLTAIRDRAQMDALHVEDALAVLPWLPDAPRLRLLDVGSGGGIPGIPLAIARPDWQVDLIEANGKKASFLTQAVIELGLANVRVLASRIEDHAPDNSYNIVISRAFSDLATFARAARAHVLPDGAIVAMKGTLPQDEINALPDDITVTGTPALDVPGVTAERHLVIMQTKGKPA